MLKKVAIAVFICLIVFLTTATNVNAADTTGQIFAQVDDILKANPLKPTETLQMINIAQDETISLFIVRMVDGHVVKKHFHKTHDEVIYIIKGAGQIFSMKSGFLLNRAAFISIRLAKYTPQNRRE